MWRSDCRFQTISTLRQQLPQSLHSQSWLGAVNYPVAIGADQSRVVDMGFVVLGSPLVFWASISQPARAIPIP